MKMISISLIIFSFLILNCDSAKILAVFSYPSLSHQIFYRPLTQELVKRGHEVVVITTDPAFPKGRAPKNLYEIDLHDISYNITGLESKLITSGKKQDHLQQIQLIIEKVSIVGEKQLLSKEVQNLIIDKSKTFDLVITELLSQPALVFSHLFKIPAIQISSFGGILGTFEMLGASSHPNIYPTALRSKSYNLTLWQNIIELHKYFTVQKNSNIAQNEINEMVKRIFDTNFPTFEELKKNVQMCFLNVHPLWDFNRPVPKNVLYVNGMHLKPNEELPEHLKSHLDESKHGAIFVSFGTNSKPTLLPPEKIQILMNVFSQLHCNVLLKWDQEDIPFLPKNVKVQKWYPQSALLKHPNIKAFVTQGGLQSTDEAIDAGVPLVGIPLQADQWFNVEKYEFYKIGFNLDMDSLTEDIFRNAIESVIQDESYRKNILKLRAIMRDEAQTALQRAVWWIEYVLRNGDGSHLFGPAAGVTWQEYFEIDLVVIILFFTLTLLVIIKRLIALVISKIISPSLKLPRWKSA